MEENIRTRVTYSDVPEVHPPPPVREDPAAAASVEWGAGSLAIGGVLTILAAIGFLLIIGHDHAHMSRSEHRLAGVIGCFIAFLLIALSGTGVAFGIVSMVAARRRGRSIALGLAGLLLGALAVLLWLTAGGTWLANTVDMF